MPTTKAKNILYRLALPFCSPSVPADPIAASEGHALQYAGILSSCIRRNHISGGAISLLSGSETASVCTKAVHTDLIPSRETYFRVASITKMATALLAIRLVDLGILDPEAPVSVLLPDGEKVPELKGIRITHLLTHTSGLSDPPNLEKCLNESRPYPEALSGCRCHEPGAVFRYSNLGFGLMGSVFESVLNRPLGEIYRDYLFEPLKMNATLEACSLPENKIMPVIRMLPYREGSALRVTPLGRIPLSSPDPLHHFGHTAGSMYADLPSLVRLACCIRDGGSSLLSARYHGLMQKQVSSYGSLSPTLSYGTGLLLVRDQRISDSVVYGHQGFAYGCVDGVFWEESSGNIMVSLNGGCSEARNGRFGIANLNLCEWAFRKELPAWK